MLTVGMDGVATSTTLSVRFSKLAVSRVEARTMRTFAGSRCKKSSQRTELSIVPALSPSSCVGL